MNFQIKDVCGEGRDGRVPLGRKALLEHPIFFFKRHRDLFCSGPKIMNFCGEGRDGGVPLSRKVLLEDPLLIFQRQRDLFFSGTAISKENEEAIIQVDVDKNLQLLGIDEYSIIQGKLLKAVCSKEQWQKIKKNVQVELRTGMIHLKYSSILFLPRKSKFRFSRGRRYVNTKVGDLIISANELHFFAFEFMCPKCQKKVKYDLLEYFMLDPNLYVHICGACNSIITSFFSRAALAHLDMLLNYHPTRDLIYRIREAFEKK